MLFRSENLKLLQTQTIQKFEEIKKEEIIFDSKVNSWRLKGIW